jgi:hypothetical protein
VNQVTTIDDQRYRKGSPSLIAWSRQALLQKSHSLPLTVTFGSCLHLDEYRCVRRHMDNVNESTYARQASARPVATACLTSYSARRARRWVHNRHTFGGSVSSTDRGYHCGRRTPADDTPLACTAQGGPASSTDSRSPVGSPHSCTSPHSASRRSRVPARSRCTRGAHRSSMQVCVVHRRDRQG